MAVAIDKISTMTLPNYAGLSTAIEGLTAKQVALVLSTRNLSEAELEEIVIQNDLITKYGAEELVKTGLLSANSVLLASEKAINAEKLEEALIEKGVNEERAKGFIQKHLQTISNGEETASVVMLNKALMAEAVERGILTEEKAAEILSTMGVVTADNLEIGSKSGLLAVISKLIAANGILIGSLSLLVATIGAVYFGIKAYNESIRKCRERAEEAIDSYNTLTSKLNENKKSITELADRYTELSKHVNRLGENVSLTEDEFSEYHSITSKIAEMYPTLVDGWDAQGNAVINLKDALSELNEEYEKSVRNANLLLMESKDDIFKNYENTIKSINQELQYAEKAMEIVKNNGSFYDIIYDSEGYKTSYYRHFEDLGLSIDDMLSNNLDTIERQLILKMQSLKDEANDAAKDVTPLLKAILQEDLDYKGLSNELQSATSFIIDQIPSSLMDEIVSKGSNAGSDFIEGFVDEIRENTDVQNAILQLFTVDLTELSPAEADQLVNSYISTIQKTFDSLGYEISAVDLKVNFGFDDIDTLADNYLTMLNEVAEKVSGIDYSNPFFESRNVTDEQLSKYSEIYHKIDEFAKQYSINTQDEIAAFQKALEEAKYDIEKTFENYLATEVTEETPKFFDQLTNSKDSLDKFQSSVKSAYDAYATLLSGNYSSNELLDSIQAINQAMSDIGSEIQWESMLGGGIGLAQVQENIERELRKYAEEILRNAGITDAEFSEILIDSIIQAQKATAEFSAMNTQLDNLQASYRTLTDAIEYYNETGFINLDTLQSLLTADENLIKMLEVENGQLVINQEAYEELVAVQLLEFKEKLDNAAAAEIEALALSKAEEATNNNAQASKDAVAKLDAETAAFKRNTEAASENAITKAIANAEDAGVSEEEIQDILDKYDEVWNAAINNYHKDFPTFMLGRDKSGSGSGSGSSSSSADKDFEETFDWIETAIDRIERSISNLNLKASSVYRSWSERNSNLKAELLDVKKEMDIQASGYNQYMQQANSVGLSEEWASKVRNGQIDINSITDKALAEQIKQYQEYYEKALDCQDAVESLRESVSKLYETAFDNIVSQFDSILSVIENSKSMLDEQINQAEERGYIANVAYYEALIKVEQKNIEQLTKERTSLQSALADAVSNGAIAEGSAEWASMQQEINDVTLAIEQANTAMIKYGNSIRDIQWQIFDLIQDRISRISSESDFLINLLSYDKQYDDRGQLTDTGMSTVGLHGMNYNVYMAQADKYAQEMLRINKELVEDPYNLELYNRKAELIELQQESILAAEDEKQAIIDMVEEGINLELDALQSLISSYEDALSAQKD